MARGIKRAAPPEGVGGRGRAEGALQLVGGKGRNGIKAGEQKGRQAKQAAAARNRIDKACDNGHSTQGQKGGHVGHSISRLAMSICICSSSSAAQGKSGGTRPASFNVDNPCTDDQTCKAAA